MIPEFLFLSLGVRHFLNLVGFEKTFSFVLFKDILVYSFQVQSLRVNRKGHLL